MINSTTLTRDYTDTAFVQLDTYACTACGKCVEACPEAVIDKSFIYVGNILVHEHVLLYDASNCTGCLKCLQACPFNAISLKP